MASPTTLAIEGRLVANNDVRYFIDQANKMLGSRYDEDVRQWIYNKQQNKVGTILPPIPTPARSWIAVQREYSAEQAAYDSQWPGIEHFIDAIQAGPPVRAQYVEPTAPVEPPAGTIVAIGPYLRDGEYSALPADNMPDGYLTRGPKGETLMKCSHATPFGLAEWYRVVS